MRGELFLEAQVPQGPVLCLGGAQAIAAAAGAEIRQELAVPGAQAPWALVEGEVVHRPVVTAALAVMGVEVTRS